MLECLFVYLYMMLIKEFISETNKNQMISTLLETLQSW